MSDSEVDLVIRGGTVVAPAQSFAADLAIKDGVIVAIGTEEAMPPAAETLDAAGKHLLPGVIDDHVHFRDPGQTDMENWQSGSAAAAVGGVTTVFDMPSTKPPVDGLEGLRIKEALASKSSHVDYGLYGLLAGHNLANLEALSAAGVVGFKCFMSSSLSGGLPAPDDGILVEALETLARLGRRCIVHAENLGVVTRREALLQEAGRTDARAHPESRPPVAAAEAVARAIAFAEWSGCRMHIAHESSADALPHIRAAKERGVDLTVETCPQYLLLTADDLAKQGGVLRCNPPIRDPGHDQALWAALLDGTVDMLATDHAPHLVETKTSANIWECKCGCLGVETALALMLTEVNGGRITLNQVVAWMAENPARAWDLYPRKGVLAVGSDADIAIADLAAEAVIDQEKLQSKARVSGWHGRSVKGAAVATLVRGKVVAREGEVVGEPGWGRHVRQQTPPPAPRNQAHTSAAIVRPPA